jgi:signal transduction histidine kinase
VRHYARRQAADLRRVIDESWPTGDQGLYAGLSDVVDEARDHGLHVDFRCPQAPDVPPAQVAAACDAVREALTNVLKHARTDRAVVRAEPRRGGLLVVVSDAGRGFDPLRVGPGFGIRESIIGRTADVRGHAEVRSRAGHGTEVTLWFEDGQHGRRGADPGHRDGGGPRTPGRGLGRITHPEGSGRRHAAR